MAGPVRRPNCVARGQPSHASHPIARTNGHRRLVGLGRRLRGRIAVAAALLGPDIRNQNPVQPPILTDSGYVGKGKVTAQTMTAGAIRRSSVAGRGYRRGGVGVSATVAGEIAIHLRVQVPGRANLAFRPPTFLHILPEVSAVTETIKHEGIVSWTSRSSAYRDCGALWERA